MIYTCLSKVPFTRKGVYSHTGTSSLYVVGGATIDQEHIDLLNLPSNVVITLYDTTLTKHLVRFNSIYWNELQLVGTSNKFNNFHEDFPEYLI